MNYIINEYFIGKPYKVETYPIGSCVVNKNGINVLQIVDKPGTKFISLEIASKLCEEWNNKVD